MRLHQLSVTAFGPFVDTVSVDFDELSAAGVFLLTGDTGAGKTSVLDATCFALYGEVPGDRHTARHLRSDHADPSAAPLVTLELTVGSRTFRFTRSPAWERPKRRGTGTTRIQAHVVVEELVDGSWTTLTNRLDEAGQLVTHLLGMTCTQFTQVAMLPQNRFQAFLRASSAERQAVLQRLFRTERFESVEQWLVQRRLDLRRQSQTCLYRVEAVVNRFAEAAGAALPDGTDDLEPADGVLFAWAETIREASQRDAEELGAALELAGTTLEEARRAHEAGREVSVLRRRGREAQRALRGLDESSDDERVWMRRLEAHRRSGPVVPLVRRAGALTTALEQAEEDTAAVVAEVSALLGVDEGEVDATLLDAATTRAAEQRVLAESWLPRERDLLVERERATSLAAEVEELSAALAAARAEHASLGHRRATLARAVDAKAPVAAGLAELEARVAHIEQAHEAACQATRLGRTLAEQRNALAVATEVAQGLRDAHLDLREVRISGMAAELASGLVAGCSCPVCGSAEHPSLATAGSRITRDDEEEARTRHETAAFEQQALQESVTTLETQLKTALLRSEGHRPRYWHRRLDEAIAAHSDAVRAVERLAELDLERASLDETDRALTAAIGNTRATLAERSSALKHAMIRRDGLTAELRALLTGHDASTAEELAAARTQEVASLTAARQAVTALDKARTDQACAVEEAVAAAVEAGFRSARQALASALTPAVAKQLEDDLDARRTAWSVATTALEDPAVVAALDQPEPDLVLLGEAVTVGGRARDRAHAAHDRAEARAVRLTTLLEDLVTALRAWEPVRREHAVAAGLSALAEGKSSDNAWRMRLSAYVLSERLRQVVAAANERLGAMTDQRFTLEQADARGAGEQRGGLSLRVRDQWSDKERDPATLSGGETFLVSLALALGLADTVSHEAGGTQLDTLFIDEGFGALDATTLDGVMDTLDSLRDGGRVVGLVSHVPELRNRVTTQLEVRKGRRGSSVATVGT